MQEVKVGQVWHGNYGNEQIKIDKALGGDVWEVVDSAGNRSTLSNRVITGSYFLFEDAEPLSDLEIVQKALANSGLELRMNGVDIVVVGGHWEEDESVEIYHSVEDYHKDFQSLFAWAKQTMTGVE